MEDERLSEGEDRPCQRAVTNEEEHLEHRGGGGPAPEVEQAQKVGPVAEVVEKVVLALLTEGVPAQADQQQALGRVPQVEVLRRAPD